MLDETGRLVASYEYDPYGRTIIESGSCAHANPLGFSSEITDRETGTMYYNYRDYNPTDGRWLTRDPIANDDKNLYTMLVNQLTNKSDYLGLMSVESCMSIISSKGKSTINLVLHKGTKCEGLYISCQCNPTIPNGKENPIKILYGITRVYGEPETAPVIIINAQSHNSENGLLNTLRHELTHYYDYCTKGVDSNCQTFWETEVRASYYGECRSNSSEALRGICAKEHARKSLCGGTKGAAIRPCCSNQNSDSQDAYNKLQQNFDNPFN